MGGRRLPSLSGLRAFEAFARTGSMTAAAQELCVTHGAVSRQVRSLEAQVGVQLVVGPRHRLVLTEAGKALAQACGAAFDRIVAAMPGAVGPELVVSCYGTLAMKWLIPRLPRFLEANAGARVRIVEEHGPVDFGRGGLHAAIRIEDGTVDDGVRRRPFMAHFHGPVLSPKVLAGLGEDSPTLFTLPRLHSDTFLEAWPAWARRAGVDLPAASIERGFEHNTYMLEAAAAGLGVAIAPWAFAGADIEAGRLVAPFGFEPVGARYVYLQPALAANPLANAFGAWLRREGRAAPAPPGPIWAAT